MDSALFMESSSKLGWQLTECRRKKTLLTRKLRRVFSFSFDLKDVSVQRGFFRKIAADGIEVELDTNGVTAD